MYCWRTLAPLRWTGTIMMITHCARECARFVSERAVPTSGTCCSRFCCAEGSRTYVMKAIVVTNITEHQATQATKSGRDVKQGTIASLAGCFLCVYFVRCGACMSCYACRRCRAPRDLWMAHILSDCHFRQSCDRTRVSHLRRPFMTRHQADLCVVF